MSLPFGQGILLPYFQISYKPVKNFEGANTLAYFGGASAAKKVSFVPLTPGDNVIKLFSFITDDETQ